MTTRRLPDKPILAPWRDYAVTPDRFLLRHADGVVVFEGRASTILVPELVSRLDGSRTVAQIIDDLGEPARPAIEQALDLLLEHGLLIEDDDEDRPDPGLRSTARSLAEVSVGTLAPGDIQGLLRGSTFVVVGDGGVAAKIADLLQESGVGSVVPVGETAAVALLEQRRDDEALTHVIVAPRLRYARVLTDVNTWALRTGRRWTQVLPYDGQNAVVGPTFVPGETGCGYCFRVRRRSTLDYFDEAVDFDAAADAQQVARSGDWHSPAQDAAVAAHAVHLALWAVLPEGSAVEPLAGRCFAVTWTMTGPAMRPHRLHRVPRCRECGRARDTGVPQPWISGSPMRQPESDGSPSTPAGAVRLEVV